MKDGYKADLGALMILAILFSLGVLFTVLAFSEEPDWVITSGEGIPVDLKCLENPEKPIEVEFCAAFKQALLDTGSVTYDFQEGSPHFGFVVIPVERDQYLSVSMASNLYFPPLDGLALSAYLGGFIVLPGAHTDAEAHEVMATRIVYASAEYVQANVDWLLQFSRSQSKPVLEAKND